MKERDPISELCERMEAEQDAFRERLLAMPPSEILEHAYAFCTREDILIIVQNGNLSEEDAKVLLTSDTPLSDIYDDYIEIESDYMDVIRSAFRYRVDEIKAEMRKEREEER